MSEEQPNYETLNTLHIKLLDAKDEQISLLNRLLAAEEEKSELLVQQNIQLSSEISNLTSEVLRLQKGRQS
jgi:hypothetical protein